MCFPHPIEMFYIFRTHSHHLPQTDLAQMVTRPKDILALGVKCSFRFINVCVYVHNENYILANIMGNGTVISISD